MTSFSETIKGMRVALKISQRELANRINVNFTYISKIERGIMEPPSEETIIKMAEVFGCDKYFLILQAGKIPSDFAKLILENGEVQEYLYQKLRGEKNEQRRDIGNDTGERVRRGCGGESDGVQRGSIRI